MSLPPENDRKPRVYLTFPEGKEWNVWLKRVKQARNSIINFSFWEYIKLGIKKSEVK